MSIQVPRRFSFSEPGSVRVGDASERLTNAFPKHRHGYADGRSDARGVFPADRNDNPWICR
jgi:hypothetical protein